MAQTHRNRVWSELTVGMEAQMTRLCREEDLFAFASASGNHNALYLPHLDGDGDGTPEGAAPPAWLTALIASVIGNDLPGPGAALLSVELSFSGAAHAGETLTAKVTLVEKLAEARVRFEVSVANEADQTIAEGRAEVRAPTKHITVADGEVPELTVRRHVHFDRLLKMAEPLPPLKTAVVAPEESDALFGAMLAAKHTLIDPVLVGAADKIRQVAQEDGLDIGAIRIIDIPDHGQAAARAVAMIHSGEAAAIMKGHLHTDELLRPIVKSQTGLRIGRRLSHVFVMDVPGLDHPLLISDAAINIAPDLMAKADIIQNAIDLARKLGIDEPKVGVLSAVETVNPAIPSTLDAAVLSKMADRGQITGGLVDGPLAFDNAINLEAARTKGITSLVAGHAQILIPPNLEAGNMLAKELTFLAHAEAGGLVVGAKCPIILTSRADDEKARLASCAIAALSADRAS